MGEDVKLYKYFAAQIEQIGKVKRAWFTTFNLDISFFEKYILSALMGKGFDELKTPYDYESLSASLANEQEAFDGEKMEVKVFYDYRTLKVEGKPKQTAVHLHPVNCAAFSDGMTRRFEAGVFHPKVSLIESYEGKYYLMVSSANLTLGGWARNREGFFFEELKSTQVAREIGFFFGAITDSLSGFVAHELLNTLKNGKFGADDQKWSFHSSFSADRFIDRLNPSKVPVPLKVWSPYFAGDLSSLIAEFQENCFDSIAIIPAKNEHQKIRLTAEEYARCEEMQGITFLQDHLPKPALEAFVHAKVWLTPTSLAIGSWNMTWSGINESKKKVNNIEAGIVYALTTYEYEQVCDRNPLSELSSPDFYKDEELTEEKQGLLDDYSISADIVIDWDTQSIFLNHPTFDELLGQIGDTARIELPGFGLNGIHFMESRNSIAAHSSVFVSDRFFEISDRNNKTLYKGYLREIGLASRPVHRFEHIDDFLKGWVSERPEEKTELFGLAYDAVNYEDGIHSQEKTILSGGDQNSWFTSFHAFECIVNRIKSTSSLGAQERSVALKRIGRVLPGSLKELQFHLEKLLELYTSDKNKFKKSPMYLWFLIEKANFVFDYFNALIDIPEEQIQPVKNLLFEEIIDTSNMRKHEMEGLEAWKKYIQTQLTITEF